MKKLASLLILSSISLVSMAQTPGSGKCLDFNGSSDYVEIPNSSGLNPGTAFTVEAWINADSWASNIWENSIVSKDTWSSISEGWVIRCGAGGKLSFNLALNSTNTWYEIQSGTLMSTNKWYHVAGTYDGSKMKMYLNGKIIDSLSQSGYITSTTAVVKLGNIARPSTSRFFDGEIDEVRLWNAALSESTLREYMCKKLDANHPNYGKLIAYWNLDAGSGNTIVDNSGNGNTGTNYGGAWHTSGAAIGDASVYAYNTSWSGKSLKMLHSSGDSAVISSVSGGPDGVHIYRVDNAPNVQTVPNGVLSFYDLRYWGVYTTSGSNPTYTITYYYNGYPGITNQGKLNFNNRDDNADTTWAGLLTTIDTTAKTILKTSMSKGEFIMGRNDELTDFTLVSPTNGITVSLQGNASQTVAFSWHTSKVGGGGKPLYSCIIDFDTANFSTPLYSKTSASAGVDTTATITYQQLATMMYQNEVYYGQTMNAQWTAQATAGPLKKMASPAFDISFSRGILTSDAIFGFFISEPNNDTLIVYNGGPAKHLFNWQRAKSTAGIDISYKVEIAGHSGELSMPLGTFTANNTGHDTLASISDADLASMLASASLPNDQVYRFKWRTLAELSTLQTYSVDSQFIYIVRKDPPYFGISGNDTENGVFIYPNPATHSVYIESAKLNGRDVFVTLYDSYGRSVMRESYEFATKQKLTLPALNSGLYFIELRNGNSVIRKRLVIEDQSN